MPGAIEAQENPQREKGQRGIDSFFKSPKSSVLKDKKDLFSYFKKIDTSPDQISRKHDEKIDNHVCQESGDIIEISDSKNDSNSSVDIDVVSIDSRADDQHQDHTEEESKTVSDINHVEMEEKGNEGKSKTSEELGSAKCNVFAFMMANRNKQNEVVKKLKEEEDNGECNESVILPTTEKNVESRNGDNNLVKIKANEPDINEVDSNKTVVMKKTDKEKKAKRSKPDKQTTKSSVKELPPENCEELDIIFYKEADVSSKSSTTQVVSAQKTSEVPNTFSGANAFAYLMANRHKQDKGLSDNECGNETSSNENDSKEMEHDESREKQNVPNEKKRKKSKGLDSSLADFNLSDEEQKVNRSNSRKRIVKKKIEVPEDVNATPQSQENKVGKVRRNGSLDVKLTKDSNAIDKDDACEPKINQPSKIRETITPTVSKTKEELAENIQDHLGKELGAKKVKKHSTNKKTKEGEAKKQKKLRASPMEPVKEESTLIIDSVCERKNEVNNDSVKVNTVDESKDDVILTKNEILEEENSSVDVPTGRPERLNVSQSEDVKADEPPKKRRRKKVNYVEDTLIENESELSQNTISSGNGASVVNDIQNKNNSSKGNISTFFKKISKEEKTIQRSKNTFTVKADVHAPYDGGQQERNINKKRKVDAVADKENLQKICSDKNERRVSRRIKKRQELEELDKIELLEQITPTNSPKKLPSDDFKNIMKELPRKIEIIQEALTKIEGTDSNSAFSKKSGKKVSKEILQDDVDQVIQATAGRQSKGTSEDPDVIKESVKEKDVKRSKRKLSKNSSTSPSNNEDQASAKEPAKPEPKIQDKSPDVNDTLDEIFPKSRTVSKDISSSTQDTESEADTSSTSRRKSKRLQSGGSAKSLDTSEDDKENIVQYTSTLIQTPGRLSLRLKRVQPTVKTKAKGKRSLSLRNNNAPERKPAHTKARELVQKAKEAKLSPKRRVKRLSLGRTKKNTRENDILQQIVNQNVVQVNMVTIENDVSDSSAVAPVRPTKKKKQMTLKPSCASTPKAKSAIKKNTKTRKVTTDSKVSDDIIDLEGPTAETSRRSSRQAAVNAKKIIEEQKEIEEIVEKPKKSEKEKNTKDTKLAPIFCKKKNIELSPSKLKARQDFLQSGVPDQIKKQVLIEKSQEEEVSEWPPFPSVSHIQQRDDDTMWALKCPKIENLNESMSNASSLNPIEKRIFNCDLMSLLKKDENNIKVGIDSPVMDLASVIAILNCLKKENPYFPTFSVFKSYLDLKRDSVTLYKKELEKDECKIKVIDLEEEEEEVTRGKRKRRSKGSAGTKRKRLSGAKGKKNQAEEKVEDQPSTPLWQEKTPHAWTQVFSPKNSSQIIGNAGHIRKMRMWLQEWLTKSEIYASKEKSKKKKILRKEDDFLVSDESSGFGDDDDFVNTYLLCGPPGVGKTSAVYALASELGYKVLEVNASSRRPGRQVMSQLAEATQSHSMSSNTSQQPVNTLAAMFAAKASGGVKRLPEKVLGDDSQNSNKDQEGKKKVALVLFEDIDIVFEEWDEGFIATVNNFMATSKRPIILTVSHSSPNVLAKIKGNYEKLDFCPPAEDILAHHLQLIGLVNGYHLCYEDVQSLVNVNKCDMRQTLQELQLWTLSGFSSEACDCLQKIQKVKGNDVHKPAKDINLTDIFPNADKIDTQHVELYPSSLWEKIHAKTLFDNKVEFNCDRRVPLQKLQKTQKKVSWPQISSNLPFLLPLPLTEKEELKNRYPLQPDDPLIKTTQLWQRHSWLSIDEDEEGPEEQTVVVEKTEEEETNVQVKIPPHIQKSSTQCLESMVSLYDTLAQLDVLEASQSVTSRGKRTRERGWWTRHPTEGLSDVQSNCDYYWAPHELTNELTQFLGERSLKCCQERLSDALPENSVTGWPQLSVKIENKIQMPSLIPHEPHDVSLQQEHQNVTRTIVSCLPAINQLNRNLSVDYIPCIRSFIRFDEIGAAVSKSRRGRRFLSHLAHLGIDLSVDEKLKMANAFLS